MAIFFKLIKNIIKPTTLMYPYIKTKVPKGFRGMIRYDLDKCIGCGLCERNCPSAAIEMLGNGKTSEFKVFLYKCTFCSQCADSCPVDAITMTENYELAELTKKDLIMEIKRVHPPES